MHRTHVRWVAGIALGITGVLAPASHAGPLDPPAGPVAETGPTQILALPYTISASGSYRLARNLTGTGVQNLTINASNVTLDLGGFTLASAADCIVIAGSNRSDISILNGSIRITTVNSGGHCIVAPTATACRAENLNLHPGGNGNGIPADAVNLGEGSVVRNCRVDGTIRVGDACIVEGCADRFFAVGRTVVTGQRCTVRGCTFYYPDGLVAVEVGDFSVVTDCSLTGGGGVAHEAIKLGNGCTLVRCSVNGSGGSPAISGLTGCAIEQCTVKMTSANVGISIGGSCTVRGCMFGGASGTGVLVNGAGNRIEGNLFTFSSTSGVAVQVVPGVTNTDNLVIRNSASGPTSPTAAFPSQPNNSVATPIDVRSAGTGYVTITDPNANLLH